MYPPLPASDDDDNCGSGIDLSNKNSHAATKIFMNADIDDEESVVVEKGKDPQYEQGKKEITASINSMKSIKSKRSKGSPPASITKSGTYFRVINVFFHETHCSKVVKLGSAPSISELDCQLFLYKSIYDSLLETYSDGSNTDINWLAFNNQYFDDVGKLCDAAKDFDQDLTSLEFKQAIEYINFHYQIDHQNNKKSGSHDEFHCFVGSCSYLFYNHSWLTAVPNLLHLAIPTLPANVMKESNTPAAS